jgi:hypothetical protein
MAMFVMVIDVVQWYMHCSVNVPAYVLFSCMCSRFCIPSGSCGTIYMQLTFEQVIEVHTDQSKRITFLANSQSLAVKGKHHQYVIL